MFGRVVSIDPAEEHLSDRTAEARPRLVGCFGGGAATRMIWSVAESMTVAWSGQQVGQVALVDRKLVFPRVSNVAGVYRFTFSPPRRPSPP
jgi:hypothetical protein